MKKKIKVRVVVVTPTTFGFTSRSKLITVPIGTTVGDVVRREKR